ncbi:MAG: NAD-dependent epimerase/dehydratase family protein [Crocinitomicaceae bacterium]
MMIDKTKPVLLTGATGYVAGWVAKRLLEDGLTIHAPIRNPNDKEKTKYLDELAANLPGTIKYFQADLLTPNSYDEAMKGCELVIHTASPFKLSIKDPQKDLVDPALKGTENVLNSVNKTDSVKRVVLTSSCASIYGDAVDTLNYPNQTMTEHQWNTTSSLKKSPYSYSKVLAEKKAWDMKKAQDRWDLVTINPSLVLGPGINPNATSESFAIMKQMGDGAMKMGAPDLNMGCVDVRDVAEAHYRAGFMPEATGRNITSAENLSMLKISELLRPTFGKNYPLPKKTIPKWLVMLVGPMNGIPRQFVKDNVGYPWKADNSKIKRELKMEFRPMTETVNDFFQQMVDNKAFSKK